MRNSVVILINILMMLSSIATAEDVLLGKVISIDKQNEKLIVRPIGRTYENNDITVTMDKNFRHDPIAIGSVVRIWGGYVNAEATKFLSRKISSEHFRFYDSTGVRSRIQIGTDKIRDSPQPPPPHPRGGR